MQSNFAASLALASDCVSTVSLRTPPVVGAFSCHRFLQFFVGRTPVSELCAGSALRQISRHVAVLKTITNSVSHSGTRHAKDLHHRRRLRAPLTLGAGGPRFKSSRPDHNVELAYLEFEMQAQRWRQHRSPVAVIAGIVDVLEPKGRINPPPDMQRVIRLDDIFAAVIEPPVS